MLLSESQLGRLSDEFSRLIEDTHWPPTTGRLEPRYTRDEVLPLVQAWLPGMGKSQLYVRADGGARPHAAAAFGVYFYPDLEIDFLSQRCLSLEVKYVRDMDPSGSISKAIGQALIYRRLAGVARSHVLLLDRRRSVRWRDRADLEQFEGLRIHMVRVDE